MGYRTMAAGLVCLAAVATNPDRTAAATAVDESGAPAVSSSSTMACPRGFRAEDAFGNAKDRNGDSLVCVKLVWSGFVLRGVIVIDNNAGGRESISIEPLQEINEVTVVPAASDGSSETGCARGAVLERAAGHPKDRNGDKMICTRLIWSGFVLRGVVVTDNTVPSSDR